MPGAKRLIMSNDFKEFTCGLADLTATERLGTRIAAGLQPGDVVALQGDLGAGKTALARAILRALDVQGQIPSPTFTLVQHYEARLPVSHYDLYRIEDASEMDELGLDSALAEGCALIEWPEKAADYLPAQTLWIELRNTGPQARQAILRGPARWASLSGENDTHAG